MNIAWRPRRFEVIVVAAIIAGLWFVLMSAFAQARNVRRGELCQSNLKQIGLASKQYERDYDEKFPLSNNWTTALLPYHKNPAGFHCPSALKSGYAVNKHFNNLAHQQVYALDFQKTPQYFETRKIQNSASGAGEAWLTEPRHPQGVGVVFADGHFEWLQKPPVFRSFSAPPKPKSQNKSRKKIG